MRGSVALRESTTSTVLWIWFGIGVVAYALIPPLRGRDPFWGWLPFWLVVAPALDLLLLRRAVVAATSRALFVRARGHRRAAPRQARRVPLRRSARLWQLPAVSQ